jgi:hypothetical protein
MAGYNRTLDELRTELPLLQVVDSIPILCGPESCSQKLATGEILYSDELHLSPYGARLFAQESGLSRKVLEAIGAPVASTSPSPSSP